MKRKLTLWLLCVLTVIACVFGIAACNIKSLDVEVKFVVDGQTYDSVTTSGSEVIDIPQDPTKEGYTFDGWYWDKDVWAKPFTANSLLDAPISSNMSVYAKMDPNTYNITYNLDGGTTTNPATYTIESSTITLSDATKTGYTFDGWYKENTYTTNVIAIASGSYGDLSLYAKFNINSYTIAFDSNGGSAVESITQNYGTEVTAPTAPTKLGYTFGGWYESGSDTAYSFTTMPAGNLSLTAKWTVNGYEITYHGVDGATNNNPATYDVEDEPLTLTAATKTGYTFGGWYTDSEYQNAITEIAVGTTGNLNLYAKWTINTYTATFKADGTTVATKTFTIENLAVEVPAVPDKTGYTKAWESYTLTISDITINAVYTPIEYTITYAETKGATNSNPATYTIESNTITLANLEVAGYTFNGWYSGETKITEIATGSTGDLTLTAKWTPVTYTITYVETKSATNSNPATYTIESDKIILSDIEATGYTFDGWYNGETKVTEIATGSAGNLTLTAKWTPVNYTIAYAEMKGATNSNPTSYTIESDKIILSDIAAMGYTFNGWYNGETKITEIATGSTGNLTLAAKWTAIEYTITYNYDDNIGGLTQGNTLKTIYTVEDEFTFTALVNKTTGYTFNGWYTEKNVGTGEKVEGIVKGTTGNKTYFAQWGIETFTITYHNVDGVTNTNATTYTIETETFTIENLAKTGYTFDGWYSDVELQTAATTTIAKGSTGDLDFYAKWTAIEYDITYNVYGGTATGNPAKYTIESKVTFANPTLDGSAFVGWYMLAENGDLMKGITKGTTGNITLYARYLTFDSKGGSAVSYTPEFSESGVTKPAAPTKDYYNFVGWYFDENYTSAYDFASLPTNSCTLYAKWTAVEYTINYILNGGTNSEENPATYTYEDTVTFANPTKIGYTFNGWYSDEKFTSSLVTGIAAGNYGEVTVYANFSINKYTISFETNGGTTVAAIEQNYGTEVTAPESPAKNGYKFVGWYSNSGLTKAYTFTTIPAENITLYAKWQLVTYKITYNLDGGKNASSNKTSYTITSSTITLANPTKTGYTFVGWYTDSEYTNAITQIASGSFGDKELFAKWEITTYSITYVLPDNATNNNPATYTSETASTELVAPTVTGYTFNGWYSDAEYKTTVTTIGGGSIGDITIYGKFTASVYDVWLDGTESVSYSVAFNLNGAEGTAPATQTVTATNAITYPTVPTRSGYLFAGWYNNAECSGSLYNFTATVTSDITLYAKWIACEKSIEVGGTASVTLNGTTEQVYSFVPLVSGDVSITVTGSYDTYGLLYSANGMLLKQDDDSGSDSNFLIVYNVTAGMEYRIAVRGFASSTSGEVTLSVTGNTTVNAGGVAIESFKTTITYGSDFTLTVPTARDGYKFLGYADKDGTMYTDNTGASIKTWDKAESTVLYSKWEKMVYTVTFNVGSGSAIDSVTLAYGERLDLNNYVTTRSGYTFNGWYLSASDTTAYEATTMPDHNLTLIAKWISFSLGSIKYDTDKTAISVNDTINAELFGAICLDTDGKLATMSVEIEGTQAAGETITVYIDATSGSKTKSVTISNVKVYGAPTITITKADKDYINPDEFTASAWGASGTDTFGNATTIKVYIDGEYKAGETATVTISSTDIAGNVTTRQIANVKVYVAPTIIYNEEKGEISVNDTINAELFNATAKDSFGENVSVSVTKTSGTVAAGNTVKLTFKATDEKGNVTTFTKSVKVYGAPTITSATTTDFKETDNITVSALGITATDTYDENLDITLTIKSGTQAGGQVMVYTATVTDIAGNVTTKDISVKIYGAPTITYDKSAIKVTEDPAKTAAIVSFDLNGGSGTIASQTVTDTVGLTYPEIPTRSGYVFAGWYTESACTSLFDFSATVTKNTTLYAKWIAYSGGEVLPVGGNITVSVVSKSSTATTSSYLAFVPLVSGSVSIYSANGLSDTYGYLYNSSKSQLTYNDDDGDGNNFKITYTVTAGTLYYVRACGYSGSGSTTVYLSASTPTAGGKIAAVANTLDVVAKDSFGEVLTAKVTLKSGELAGGKTAVYTITAVDKLGNTTSIDTAAIKVYDVNDIKLTYNAGDSDKIKLSSCGEEFSASATDSFGNACTISIEAAEGYTLKGGNTINLYIVATDAAGNFVKSDLISDIKVYDMPTVTYKYDAYYMYSTDSVKRLWTITDSFGETLGYTATQSEEVDHVCTISFTVSDDAGNVVTINQEVIVLTDDISVLCLFVDGEYYGEQIVTKGESYTLPAETGYNYIWKYNDEAITDGAGASLAVWAQDSGYYKVETAKNIITYAITYNLNGGTNNSANPSSYTIESIGGVNGKIALQNPTKIASYGSDYSTLGNGNFSVAASAYTFDGWYLEDTFTTKVTEITYAMGNVSVYAKWLDETTTASAEAAYVRVDADGNVSTTGSYILFGSYPQSKVTDSSLCNTLPTVANSTGTLPTASNANGWTDYGYYISGSVTSYMWYIDATYNGEKYRGVYFTSYRPYYTSYSSSTGNTNQDDNGYSTSTVYWFKYEPIKWRILTESNGTAMLLAEMIIDSQEYYNKASSETTRSRTAVANYNDAYYAGNGTTVSGSVYDNNYQYSNVRKWLNETFYATAFSDLQKALIATTTVNNSAATTTDANGNITQATSYACSNTNDKVFLLSEKEVTTTSYGFASYSTNDTARQKKTTAYAQCQGAYTYSTTGYTYTGCGWWWLRSPYSDDSYRARNVSSSGYASSRYTVDRTFVGVVPALNIRL